MDTPLAMNDQELYGFWTEQLGVNFLPGTDPVLAARVLRAIEQAPRPVWEKLEWVERLFEATPGKLAETATHLESELAPAADGVTWKQLLKKVLELFRPRHVKQKKNIQEEIGWLAQQCTTFDELHMPHLWVTHLLLCALSPDLMERIDHPTRFSGTALAVEWLRHGQSLPAFCVLDGLLRLLASPPLANRPEIDPDQAKTWVNRGGALQNLGRLEEALTAYDQALALLHGPLAGHAELDPDRATAWMNSGTALQILGRLEAALAAYDQALALLHGPLADRAELNHTLHIYINRSTLLLDLYQWKKALTDCDHALALFDGPLVGRAEFNPMRAKAWNNRAIAYWRLGQLNDAIVASKRAQELLDGPLANQIELDPDRALVWMNRSGMFLEFNQIEAALAANDQALILFNGSLAKRNDLDQYKASNWINRSAILLRLGQWKDSLAASDQALDVLKVSLARHAKLGYMMAACLTIRAEVLRKNDQLKDGRIQPPSAPRRVRRAP